MTAAAGQVASDRLRSRLDGDLKWPNQRAIRPGGKRERHPT